MMKKSNFVGYSLRPDIKKSLNELLIDGCAVRQPSKHCVECQYSKLCHNVIVYEIKLVRSTIVASVLITGTPAGGHK